MINEEKRLKDITVRELREIISEEFMKQSCAPTYVPPYYCPWQPAYPYQHQEVWATTNSIEGKEILVNRRING